MSNNKSIKRAGDWKLTYQTEERREYSTWLDRGKERSTCTNHYIDHIYTLIYEPTGQKVKEVRSQEHRHSVGTYEAGPDGIYLAEDGQHISIIENNGLAVKRYTWEELLELMAL